jgi:hypothetical protein
MPGIRETQQCISGVPQLYSDEKDGREEEEDKLIIRTSGSEARTAFSDNPSRNGLTSRNLYHATLRNGTFLPKLSEEPWAVLHLYIYMCGNNSIIKVSSRYRLIARHYCCPYCKQLITVMPCHDKLTCRTQHGTSQYYHVQIRVQGTRGPPSIKYNLGQTRPLGRP